MPHLEIYRAIDEATKELCYEFKKNPDIFLTESDVKAFLYHLLITKSPLCNLTPTLSGTKTHSVHTEIRFYGNSGRLKYLSDIVVLDPSDLSTKSGGSVKISSKGFSFDDYHAIIEIKLQRTTCKKNLIRELDDDIEKIKRIVKESTKPNPSSTELYFLYLDRKDDIQEKINEHFRKKKLPKQYQLFYRGIRSHRRRP